MKTVVSTDQVAHLWANQSQQTARNSSRNFYFDGATVFSYGSHFPIAVFSPWIDADGNKIAVFNGARYSNTTGRHIGRVQRALRNHPVRIVTVHGPAPTWDGRGSLSARECEQIARGDISVLLDILKRTAAHAADAVKGAMRRRSATYAAYGLDSAEFIYADLDVLAAAAGKNARERAKLARAIEPRPEIPRGYFVTDTEYGYERQTAAPNFWEIVAPLRDAMRKASAMDDSAHWRKVAAETWKEARSTKNSARYRFDRAESCARAVQKVSAILKRARVDYPRELPTVDKARRLVETLRPRAAAQWVADQIRNVEKARADVMRDYWLGKHCRANAAARAAYGRPWNTCKSRFADRDSETMRATVGALSRFIADCFTVIPECAAEVSELFCYAMPIAAENSRRGRAMQRALQTLADTLERFDVEVAPIREKIARAELRDSLEDSARIAAGFIRDARETLAGNPKLESRGRGYGATRGSAVVEGAINKAQVYARELTEAREKAPELCRGLPESFDVRDLESGKARADFVTYAAHAAQSFAECAGFFAHMSESETYGRPFTARDFAAKALTAARNFDSANAAARKAATECGETYTAAGDSAELLARAVREFERLREHCRGMSESETVAAWRRFDNAARDGIRYGYGFGSPRFRVATNGQEIESSLGARVSIAAGRILWRLIRRAVQSGQAIEFEYGKGPHIGAFQVRRIGADGSALVGCHDIGAQEARDFARFMNWPDLGVAPESDADDCAA